MQPHSILCSIQKWEFPVVVNGVGCFPQEQKSLRPQKSRNLDFQKTPEAGDGRQCCPGHRDEPGESRFLARALEMQLPGEGRWTLDAKAGTTNRTPSTISSSRFDGSHFHWTWEENMRVPNTARVYCSACWPHFPWRGPWTGFLSPSFVLSSLRSYVYNPLLRVSVIHLLKLFSFICWNENFPSEYFTHFSPLWD